MTTVIAFSNAFFAMMSSGLMPSLSMFNTAAPASRQSFFFAGLIAAWALLPGRLMPIASMALAMVLAVYMPPQEPGPGIAQAVIWSSPLSERLSFACAPTASNTETISSFFAWPVMQPGKIVPP